MHVSAGAFDHDKVRELILVELFILSVRNAAAVNKK